MEKRKTRINRKVKPKKINRLQKFNFTYIATESDRFRFIFSVAKLLILKPKKSQIGSNFGTRSGRDRVETLTD